MKTIETSTELYHFGIKGRSGRYPLGSGERPFQGKRYITLGENSKTSSKKKDFSIDADKAFKPGKDGKPSKAEKLANAAKGTMDSSIRITNTIMDAIRRKKNPPEDLSKYSNKELQDVITRKSLERQYRSVTAPESSKGERVARNILSVVGEVVGIAAAGVGMAAAIYQIKK